ncbi:ABC transporter ATP-binding protein [Balneolales bacterium ANBcel1]|nr:ABC transporter ATP-binding protein [Balneolales bacterium ANBcel1]
MKDLLKLNHFFFKYRWTLLLGSFLLILANFFLIWIPIYIRRTMDEIEQIAEARKIPYDSVWATLFSEEVGWMLATNTGYLVGAVLIYGLLLFATRQTLIVTSRKIEFDLRNDVYGHLQKLPQSFFDSNKSGDIYTRATEDIVRVREYFGPAYMYTVNTLSRAGIIIAIMVMVNPKLTLWALLPLPFLAAMAYWVSRFINRRSNEIQQQYALMAGKIQEVYSSIRLIKAYNREEYEKDRFLRESMRYRRKKLRLDLVESLFHPMLLLLIGLSIVLVVWQGGLMVMQGTLSVGNIAEFIIYVTYLTWPVASLGYTLNLLQRSAASNTRIQKLMNVTAETGRGETEDRALPGAWKDAVSVPAEQASGTGDTQRAVENKGLFRKEMVFRNVTFTYPGASEPSLKNINMTIKAGERVGIVGRTGAGKSTLLKLLPRIYDPDEGEILIDGVDIRKLKLSELRSIIGFVPQETFLFSESIGNNIAFGKEDASRDEVWKAAEQAQVLENILEFEKKFDTILGERGVTLSGGQKQRASIARALIRKPPVLVLDDSLSAVDTKTEDAIISHLDSDFAHITMFITCHRLSSLRYADTIYVLDDGQVMESGSHEELLSRDGYFANMYRKQLIEEELEQI